jgi:hypothetical protein
LSLSDMYNCSWIFKFQFMSPEAERSWHCLGNKNEQGQMMFMFQSSTSFKNAARQPPHFISEQYDQFLNFWLTLRWLLPPNHMSGTQIIRERNKTLFLHLCTMHNGSSKILQSHALTTKADYLYA